jgi:hypothetical protein
VVDQAAHHAVVASLRRGRDGQQQRPVTLAGAGGHGLEGVVGDDMELVDQGHARIPALQAARVGGQGHEHAVGPRLQEMVGEHLHPGGQVFV